MFMLCVRIVDVQAIRDSSWLQQLRHRESMRHKGCGTSAGMSLSMLQACSITAMTKHTQWQIEGQTAFDLAQFETGDWHTLVGDESRIYVRVGRTDEGRIVLTGLIVEGDELTATGLREIRMRDVLAAIADHDTALNAWRSGDAPAPEFVGEIGPTGLARFDVEPVASTVVGEPIPSKRGQPVSDDAYRQFAETYARFAAYPDPIRRTCDALFISRATAHRRLNEVRERGLLNREDER